MKIEIRYNGPRPEFTDEQKKNNAEWLAALRGGVFTQAYGHLKNDDGFCCLGVDCEIAGVERDGNEYNFGVGTATGMPDYGWFLERHGFDVYKLNYEYHNIMRVISSINDTKNVNFNKIADLLEAFFNGETEIEIEL